MLTDSIIAENVALAGPDFTWAGVSGTSRVPNTVRKELRADLAARQGFICFVCGDTLDGSAEFNHIVSRGPGNKGWRVGNIAIGHSACNTRCKDAGPVVTLAQIARPDVVPMEWTPFPVLKASK
jgi:hypothetical protein